MKIGTLTTIWKRLAIVISLEQAKKLCNKKSCLSCSHNKSVGIYIFHKKQRCYAHPSTPHRKAWKEES